MDRQASELAFHNLGKRVVSIVARKGIHKMLSVVYTPVVFIPVLKKWLGVLDYTVCCKVLELDLIFVVPTLGRKNDGGDPPGFERK